MWWWVGVIFITAAALLFYASLWAPGLSRYVDWWQTDIRVGWLSRLGFTLFLGAVALNLAVGPFERYRGVYVGVLVAGIVLILFGQLADYMRDRA